MPAWGYHIFEVTEPAKKLTEEKSIIVAPKHDLITL